MEYRVEHDSLGEVKVPADHYWGAQTERSHENFQIGVGIETMHLAYLRRQQPLPIMSLSLRR